jgi:hypothetical protein
MAGHLQLQRCAITDENSLKRQRRCAGDFAGLDAHWRLGFAWVGPSAGWSDRSRFTPPAKATLDGMSAGLPRMGGDKFKVLKVHAFTKDGKKTIFATVSA